MLRRYTINIILAIIFTSCITYILNPYINTTVIWIYISTVILLYCISITVYVYWVKYKVKMLTNQIQSNIISSLEGDLKDFYLNRDILDYKCEKVKLTKDFNYYDLVTSTIYIDFYLAISKEFSNKIKEEYTIAIIRYYIDKNVYELDYNNSIKSIIKSCSKIKDDKVKKFSILYLKNLLKFN